jgi:hypothetical protein
VLGLQDPWLPEGKALLEKYYEPNCARMVLFQGGHHIPSKQADIDAVAMAVRGVWEKVRPLG